MKLLGKIAVILMAALMVAGATLALENTGALSGLTAGGHGERGERHAAAPVDADSAWAAGDRSGRGEGGGFGRRDQGGDWASGLLGIARNLGIIAAVVAGVWLIGWLSRQATIRHKLSKAQAGPALEEEAIPKEKV